MPGSDKNLPSGDLPVNDLFEIHDSEIDLEAITAEIQMRLQQRRQDVDTIRPQFSTFGGSLLPDRPDDIAYDADLFDHLEMVNEQYTAVPYDSDLQPSPATRVPILGPLWAMIREQAHGLVLFYTNRSAGHQTGVNREIVTVLNRLTALGLEQQRTIKQLQTELDAVRAELEDLKGDEE
jgi:hypothetical protein